MPTALERRTVQSNLKEDDLNAFAFHFAKELNCRLNEFQVFLSEEMAYVQMVGTKGTLFSNTIDGLSIHVNLINEYFNLDRMEAFFFDF